MRIIEFFKRYLTFMGPILTRYEEATYIEYKAQAQYYFLRRKTYLAAAIVVGVFCLIKDTLVMALTELPTVVYAVAIIKLSLGTLKLGITCAASYYDDPKDIYKYSRGLLAVQLLLLCLCLVPSSKYENNFKIYVWVNAPHVLSMMSLGDIFINICFILIYKYNDDRGKFIVSIVRPVYIASGIMYAAIFVNVIYYIPWDESTNIKLCILIGSFVVVRSILQRLECCIDINAIIDKLIILSLMIAYFINSDVRVLMIFIIISYIYDRSIMSIVCMDMIYTYSLDDKIASQTEAVVLIQPNDSIPQDEVELPLIGN